MRRTIIIILALLLVYYVKSQNVYTPWIVGISMDYVDYHIVDRQFEDFFTKTDWMGSNFPSALKLGHRFNNSFTVSGMFSFYSLEMEKLNEIPLQETILNNHCLKLTVQAEYKFANGYLLQERGWFDPFILIGAGVSQINNEPFFTQVTGIGSNFWFSENVGINIQASYNFLPEMNDYMNYAIGITSRLGVGDKDKDGISNKKDKCPEIPGFETLFGCPDYDKDGIPDHLDRCPRESGSPDDNGCPDLDNDGVIDSFDRCPDLPGTADLYGCPDMDHDGIPDIDDKCPSVYGLSENKGCPGIIEMVEQQNVEVTQEQNVEVVQNQTIEVVQNQTVVKADSVPISDEKIPEVSQPTAETVIPNKEEEKSKPVTYSRFLIVAGSFENLDNANKLMDEYKSRGFKPELTGLSTKGYYTVIIASYQNFNEALNALQSIKATINPDAWILPL